MKALAGRFKSCETVHYCKPYSKDTFFNGSYRETSDNIGKLCHEVFVTLWFGTNANPYVGASVRHIFKATSRVKQKSEDVENNSF